MQLRKVKLINLREENENNPYKKKMAKPFLRKSGSKSKELLR